jgi:hypothetical protein
MELIHWNASIANGLAGQSGSAYTWLALFMDTSELDILMESPASPEALKYFTEHCIASHTLSAAGRLGTISYNKLTTTYGAPLVKHLGAYSDDGQQEIRVCPESMYFGTTVPRDIFAFYTPHYSLAAPQRNIPIVWGTDFISAEIVQTFEPCFVKDVKYAPGIASATNQRPTSVRLECLVNGSWQDLGLIVGSGTNIVSGLVERVCSGIKLTVAVASAGQVGWSIDTFYATTDQRRCVSRPIQTILLCPIMYNILGYPTALDWSTTRCPVFAFDKSECETNREEPSVYTPIVFITEDIKLEATAT